MNAFEEVRKGLKEYLERNSKFKPKVMNSPKGNYFPKVVVMKIDDREISSTTLRLDVKSSITFEIDIFAKEQGVSEVSIAAEIEELVKEYMGTICGFKRTLDKPTPNIDTSVYRITMRYTANLNEFRNVFY